MKTNLLLLSILWGTASFGAATYDSAKACKQSTGASAVTSRACTTGSLAGGEFLFITYTQNSGSGTTTVADNNGSPVACTATTGGSIGRIAKSNGNLFGIFCEPNAAAGTHTITVTYPSSQGFQSMFADPFIGLTTGTTFDATCQNTTNTCSSTITPTVAGGAVYSLGDCGGSPGALTHGTGFTAAGTSTDVCAVTEYLIPANTSAVTVAWVGTGQGTLGVGVPPPASGVKRLRGMVISQ